MTISIFDSTPESILLSPVSTPVKTETLVKENKEKRSHHLTGDILMSLHTRVGRSLFKGLLRFAQSMRVLHQAAQEDDPYAEWILLKTQERLHDIHEKVKQWQDYYQHALNQLRGLEVQLFGHRQPEKFPLHFMTPFSYMAARLITDIDYVVRQIYTLRRLGIILGEDNVPSTLGRGMYDLFALSKQWKYTGVTRKDIAENNQKAQQAISKMGKVPLRVLKKEITSSFLPKARRTSS